MQTPAERDLVQRLVSLLNANGDARKECRILNAGAGKSLSIERQISKQGCSYLCDRIDVEDCSVDFPMVGECWCCSIEDMSQLDSQRYDIVFANYVLEHVEKIQDAAREIFRVLVPGGVFISTISNPSAPEFAMARKTPLWFHKLIRRQDSWETQYAYNSVEELLSVFHSIGLKVEEENRWPIVEGYLHKYPVLGPIGRFYDRMVSKSGNRRLMGDVCFVLRRG
ncbi:MAG: class I SAM-dependent methyltransferase [Candidatus Krumholzibacteria bacterium]|nr:class I SAM-dependent methyltransferase [Candidatus Krumholzibacteria bacterium]